MEFRGRNPESFLKKLTKIIHVGDTDHIGDLGDRETAVTEKFNGGLQSQFDNILRGRYAETPFKQSSEIFFTNTAKLCKLCGFDILACKVLGNILDSEFDIFNRTVGKRVRAFRFANNGKDFV